MADKSFITKETLFHLHVYYSECYKVCYITHTAQWKLSHVHVCKCAGRQRKAWERMSVAASIPLFMPHTKAWHLQLATFFITGTFLYVISLSCSYLILKVILVCVRLKRMLASDKQGCDKGGNASFIQILISFYIQSEVMSRSAFSLLFFNKLKNHTISAVSKSHS